MGYTKRVQLVSRRGYSGFGDIGDFFKSILTSYGQSQQAAGALTQAQLDAQRQAALAQGGFDMTDAILLGGVGLAAYFLLFKKKSAT